MIAPGDTFRSVGFYWRVTTVVPHYDANGNLRLEVETEMIEPTYEEETA